MFMSTLFVGKNSNAQNAGILTGDVLLALSGKNIQGVDDLVTRLQTFEIGESVTIRLKRGLEEMDVDVLLRKITP